MPDALTSHILGVTRLIAMRRCMVRVSSCIYMSWHRLSVYTNTYIRRHTTHAYTSSLLLSCVSAGIPQGGIIEAIPFLYRAVLLSYLYLETAIGQRYNIRLLPLGTFLRVICEDYGVFHITIVQWWPYISCKTFHAKGVVRTTEEDIVRYHQSCY